jgi:hypothetical protein
MASRESNQTREGGSNPTQPLQGHVPRHPTRAPLYIAPCQREAAEYAVLQWHYSKCMPSGKLVHYGVWERGDFVGVVIFGRGATPNLLKPFKLGQEQGCELVRIALTTHTTPVTRIVSIALKMLAKSNPGLKVVVSFADDGQGHIGGIYQGGNWVYTGAAYKIYYRINGKVVHPRTVARHGPLSQSIHWIRLHLDPSAVLVPYAS